MSIWSQKPASTQPRTNPVRLPKDAGAAGGGAGAPPPRPRAREGGPRDFPGRSSDVWLKMNDAGEKVAFSQAASIPTRFKLFSSFFSLFFARIRKVEFILKG